MASTTNRRLSDAERAERRRQDRERLQQAARELLTSEGWRRWVRVRSQAGLARLSLSNQLLVAMARPDATFVAGFKGWLRLGYAVSKYATSRRRHFATCWRSKMHSPARSFAWYTREPQDVEVVVGDDDRPRTERTGRCSYRRRRRLAPSSTASN